MYFCYAAGVYLTSSGITTPIMSLCVTFIVHYSSFSFVVKHACRRPHVWCCHHVSAVFPTEVSRSASSLMVLVGQPSNVLCALCGCRTFNFCLFVCSLDYPSRLLWLLPLGEGGEGNRLQLRAVCGACSSNTSNIDSVCSVVLLTCAFRSCVLVCDGIEPVR